ncbi:MAG: PilZ domain-containing protein [Pyrinomonadaceae bacterium]
MLKVKDSIAGRLKSLLANHIYVRRNSARLPVTVSLVDSKTGGDASAQYPLFKGQKAESSAMSGYMHDISRTGLSLIVPSFHFGNHYLIDCSNYTLRIMVELPNGVVNVQAAPVRFNKLDDSRYFIGARFMKMTDADHRRLTQYIKSGKVVAEVIDSVGRWFYNLMSNHLHVRRSGMDMPVTVSLLDLGKNPVVARLPAAMTGVLRDISKTGVSLVLPSVSFGDRFLTDGYCEMRIMVELPNGAVNIQAAPVRYDKFDEAQSEGAYLVGARILRMTVQERKSLVKRIQQVKKRAAVRQPGFALARDYSKSSS